jgi:hypothetical protein
MLSDPDRFQSLIEQSFSCLLATPSSMQEVYVSLYWVGARHTTVADLAAFGLVEDARIFWH